jgi:hypothetical protein
MPACNITKCKNSDIFSKKEEMFAANKWSLREFGFSVMMPGRGTNAIARPSWGKALHDRENQLCV